MRKNNHCYRLKARTSASSPTTRTEPPTYTGSQRKNMRQGLRILAKIIARAHLRRQEGWSP